MLQTTKNSAVISPQGAYLGEVNGRGPYYSHAIFVSEYRPFTPYAFQKTVAEYEKLMIASNPGAAKTDAPEYPFELDSHRAVLTSLVNPTSPIGREDLFIVFVDRGTHLSVLAFTVPDRDGTSCNQIITNSSLSVKLLPKEWVVTDQSGTGDVLTPQQIAQRGLASMVLIVSGNKAGKHITLGTGFVVAPGVIATNSHVFTIGALGFVRTFQSSKVLGVVSVLGRDPGNDLALLSVPGLELPALPLATVDSSSIGDTVYAIGNPEGMEGTFSAGLISGNRQFQDRSLIQITAPISHGSSGGPIMNTLGQVIGLSTLMLKPTQKKQGRKSMTAHGSTLPVPRSPLIHRFADPVSEWRS